MRIVRLRAGIVLLVGAWAWLGGCGAIRGNGTAVGNPGKMSLRLAPDAQLRPWRDASVEAIRLVLRSCTAGVWARGWGGSELLGLEPQIVAVGDWCALELALQQLSVPGAVEPSDVDVVIPLEGATLQDTSWVLELGEPGDLIGIEQRSALYRELVEDGALDPLERSLGPEHAGEQRSGEAFAPEVLMAVGSLGLRAPLTGAGQPSYAQLDEGEALWDVVHADGLWVAVGGGELTGRAAVSDDDGLSWALADVELPLAAVEAYGGQLYAVTYTGEVRTSADGLAWTVQQREPRIWRDLVAGPDRLVVVGDGALLSSVDGQQWISEELPDASQLVAVTWGPPGFVAVGVGGVRWHSPDGVSWTKTAEEGSKLESVAWAGARFVAVGEGQTWFSPDGIGWAPGPDGPPGALQPHSGALYGLDGARVLRSDDQGASWSLSQQLDEAEILIGLGSNTEP